MVKRRHTTQETRKGLYAAARYLNRDVEEELGVQIPFTVYPQDPFVAEADEKFGIDEEFFVRWEPGLADGPTSARFAVVDFNGDSGQVAPMAKWDNAKERFLGIDGEALDKQNMDNIQFHQVNIWATLQRALEFFEHGWGLGRPVPYGFEGNRLIVVPHAGYGKNAYYDRTSKSLQFYYFDRDDGKRVYTCLSADIINHEFGHAMLDGIRPYFIQSALLQTGALHEYVADMTAILLFMRNNRGRKILAKLSDGDLAAAPHLATLAEEFGNAVSDKPYLRTALNKETLDTVPKTGPHKVSEVMTGAMFDILIAFSNHYVNREGTTAPKGFWQAVQRMQRVALQPLDLLPPVDATFRDYALCVLRAEELANPTDPYGYRNMMLKVFVDRKILTIADAKELSEPSYIYERLQLDVFHDINSIARSRASSYSFLNDNRDALFIPENCDFFVADLYETEKLTREARRLPKQIVLEYLWREDVQLDQGWFGEYEGQTTTMLCGGTLVFDENGTVLSWMRKPGCQGGTSGRWGEEIARGKARRDAFLASIADRINAGQVGTALGSAKGLLGSQVPTLSVIEKDGRLQFGLSPHMSLDGDDHDNYEGGRLWEVSS